MVLGEERRDSARRGTVERECKSLKKTDLIWNSWPSQEFGGELAMLMPYGPVRIKEIKNNNNNNNKVILKSLYVFLQIFCNDLLNSNTEFFKEIKRVFEQKNMNLDIVHNLEQAIKN